MMLRKIKFDGTETFALPLYQELAVNTSSLGFPCMKRLRLPPNARMRSRV